MIHSEEQLSDKVIFLTGGTTGIGYACALAYHRQGAKISIIANSRRSIEEAGNTLNDDRIHYIFADVTSAASMQSAIAATIDRFGKIDCIHNNAGTATPSKTLCETTEAEWDYIFNVNVKGIHNTTLYGIGELKKNKGSILNTSSMVGEIGQERHAAYTATKGAVNALTKSMALDYAPFGIRVNAIAPAGVWTPMLREWTHTQPDPAGIGKYLDNIHVLGYCPEADVVADACLFLVSEQARFITGCILPVSGGAELGYRR